MADSKVSALVLLASGFANGDLFNIVDVSDTTMGVSGSNKRVTFLTLATELLVAAGLSVGSATSPGSFSTLAAAGAVNLSPASFNVVISPTGTGLVTINPATAGTVNNMSIGATSRSTGAFTTLAANGAVTFTAGTASTSTITGTVIVTGGVGISGALFVGSMNKITFTQPTTSATLTLVQGSTLATAGAFSITLTSTANTTVTLPTTGTLSTLAGVETLTNKTLSTGCVIPWDETIVVSAKGVDATSGTNKAYFDLPFAVTLTAVQTTVDVAPGGSTIIVDVNKNGTSVFSTRSSIDIAEFSTATAAVPSVISTSALSAGDRISFDIDQTGSTPNGQNIIVTLRGTRVLP